MTYPQGNLKTKKATIYVQAKGITLGNIQKIEVKEVEVLRRQWAQYPGAVDARWKEPRQRKWRRYVEGYRPYLVVLEGWGHPDPDSPWLSTSDITEKSRYSSCSDQWGLDFDKLLATYLKANPSVKVLGDYRDGSINPYDASAKAEFDAHEINSIKKQLVDAGISRNLAVNVAELYVTKSPNWAAGILCQEGHCCTTGRGRHRAESIHINGQIVEPEPFFSKAS